MSSWSTTRTLRALVLTQLVVVLLGLAVEAVDGTNAPDQPVTEAVVAVSALAAYVGGLIGLWLKRRWGVVLFSLAEIAWLTPPMNDPIEETRLSLALGSTQTLIAGLVLGLVLFAMRDEFRGARPREVAGIFS